MGSSIDYQKILRRWKSSGYFLGNHTFSHISHHEKGTQELIQDIQKNESTLIDFVDTIEELKVFRFPYLEEGNSKQQRYDARFYLNQRKYRTAQVTMDFEDWSWQVPLKRCLDEKNEEKIKELKEAYLKFALDRIETSQSMSQKIWGAKKIKHILLLHFNAPLALWMNDLLKKLSEKGVQFISSKEAIYDSFYDEDTTYMGSVGKTYIMQAFETRNISNHGLTLPVKPTEWLEKQCLQGIRQNN
jgi:peptidoglycan/xylan/chitin deacetylase (PgdA/CDA1 family)